MCRIIRYINGGKPVGLGLLVACLVLSIFAFSANAESSSPKGSQWTSVGGKIVASGKHEFKNKWWAAHRYADGGGKFWKTTDPSLLIPNVKLPSHSLDEVLADVLIPKGQISVQGPGFLAVYKKGSGSAKTVLKFPSGKVFHSASLGKMDLRIAKDGNKSWHENNVVAFDPSKGNGGWVPDGKTLTLDVWAYSDWNDWAIWGRGYAAPKELEYEIWFFAREGGSVIKASDINTAAFNGSIGSQNTTTATLPENFGFETDWLGGVRPAGGEAGDVDYNFNKPEPIINPVFKPSFEPPWSNYKQDMKNLADSIANNVAQLKNSRLSSEKRNELNGYITDQIFALAEMQGEQMWLDHASTVLMDSSKVILSYNPVVGPYLSAATIVSDGSQGNWGNAALGIAGYLGKVVVNGKVIVNNLGQLIQLGADYYQKVIPEIFSATSTVKSGKFGGAYPMWAPGNSADIIDKN